MLGFIVGVEMIPDRILRRWSQDQEYFELRTNLLQEWTNGEIQDTLDRLVDKDLIDYEIINDGENIVVKINQDRVMELYEDSLEDKLL